MTLGSVCSLVLCVLLVVAGVIDARERRLPNGLATALSVVAVVCAGASGGVHVLVVHAVCALVVCGVLMAFELWWRKRRGTSGQGIGDIKALGALMLATPLYAVVAYALALLVLALCGLVARRRSLPLLPFLAVTYLVLTMSNGSIALL